MMPEEKKLGLKNTTPKWKTNTTLKSKTYKATSKALNQTLSD